MNIIQSGDVKIEVHIAYEGIGYTLWEYTLWTEGHYAVQGPACPSRESAEQIAIQQVEGYRHTRVPKGEIK